MIYSAVMAPETPTPVTGLMLLVPRLARQILRRGSPEQLGLDLRLLMALSYLADRDGAPQQDLDDVLCIDARNVVVLLNELEELGLVIRVHLTNSGHQALAHAAHVHTNIEDDLLQALNADERAILRRLTARVLHGAEPHSDSAPSETLAPST
jgi:DNA-binding MarR family transcriptional regulator